MTVHIPRGKGRSPDLYDVYYNIHSQHACKERSVFIRAITATVMNMALPVGARSGRFPFTKFRMCMG